MAGAPKGPRKPKKPAKGKPPASRKKPAPRPPPPPPKKRGAATPAAKKPARPPRKRSPRPAELFVDSAGRWRDARGHFISRENLLSRIRGGLPEDVSILLYGAAAQVRENGDRRSYMVVAEIESPHVGPTWVSLSHAHGLRAALTQAAQRLSGEDPWLRRSAEKSRDITVILDLEIRETKRHSKLEMTFAKKQIAKSAAIRKAQRASKKAAKPATKSKGRKR